MLRPRAAAPRRRSPASCGSGDPLATSSPGAAPSLELTISRQNVALGQEKQHAGQVADRPQRLGRSLHFCRCACALPGQEAGLWWGRAEGGVSGLHFSISNFCWKGHWIGFGELCVLVPVLSNMSSGILHRLCLIQALVCPLC